MSEEFESKIAVCVPTYNDSKRLVDCLSSIIDQKRKADVIVVYDDGSTDDTCDVVARFVKGGNKIEYIKESPNGGIGKARHELVKHVQENHPEVTHLCFLSSDDRYLPEYLENMAVMVERFPHTVFYSGYYIMNEQKVVVAKLVPHQFEHYIDFQINSIENATMNKMTVNYSTTIFPIEVFKYVQFDPYYRQSEDLDHFLRAMMLFEYKPINVPLIKISGGDNTTSRTFHKIPEFNREIMKEFFADLEQIRKTVMTDE